VYAEPLAQAIFCNGLVLHDGAGGTSTIRGLIRWEDETGSDGGDH
jgi:hypothetical protein